MKTALQALCTSAVFLGAGGLARGQAPYEDPLTTNVWVFDVDAQGHLQVTTLRVLDGAPTLGAEAALDGGVVVHGASASVELSNVPGTASVQVQDGAGGHPASTLPPGALPSSWMLGFAASAPVTSYTPYADVSPLPGTYTRGFVAELTVEGPSDGTTRLHWGLSGALDHVATTWPLAFALSGEGTVTLSYALEHGGVTGPTLHATWVIDSPDDTWLDSDGDGLPDAIEHASGNDPLAADLGADGDGDGVSNIEELACGTDPDVADSTCPDDDGDGWLDVHEGWRGTDPHDAGSFPAARSTYGPEVRGAVAAFDDLAHVVPAARAWTLFATTLDGAPTRMRAADGLAASGAPPAIRLAAEDLQVLAARADVGPWVVSALVAPVEGADLSIVAATLAAQGAVLTDASVWIAGAAAIMPARLVHPRLFLLDPRGGVPVALLQALAAWHGGVATLASDHTTGLAALADGLAAVVDPDWLATVDALTDAAIAGPWTDPRPRLDAALVASLPGTIALHAARVVDYVGEDTLAALGASAQAALFDPGDDFDGDGRTNGLELGAAAFVAATDPRRADSDADEQPDGVDPCPLDADDLCWTLAPASADSDADGVADASDNCLNVANTPQADGDADGVGDACDGYGVIDVPRTHVNTRVGVAVPLRARLTQRGATAPDPSALVATWTFVKAGVAGDALPARVGLEPGDVTFTSPGEYTITLTITSPEGPPSSSDWRLARVLAAPTPALQVPAIDITPTCRAGVAAPSLYVRMTGVAAPPSTPTRALVVLPTTTSGGRAVTLTGLVRLGASTGTLEVTTSASPESAPDAEWVAADPLPFGVTALRATWPAGLAGGVEESLRAELAVPGAGLADLGQTLTPSAPGATITPAVLGACPTSLTVSLWFDDDHDGARDLPADGALDWTVDVAVDAGTSVPGADDADQSATASGGVATFDVWPGQLVLALPRAPSASGVAPPTWALTGPPAAATIGLTPLALSLGAGCTCADASSCTSDACTYPGVCSFCEGGDCSPAPATCRPAPIYVLLEDRATGALVGGAACDYDPSAVPPVRCPTRPDGTLAIDPELECR